MGLPWWLSGKESACNAGDVGDVGLIPGWADPLREEMVTHSSILAWRIPWTEEPGGLTSMGSQRVGDDCVTEHAYTFIIFYGQFLFFIFLSLLKRTFAFHEVLKRYPSFKFFFFSQSYLFIYLFIF